MGVCLPIFFSYASHPPGPWLTSHIRFITNHCAILAGPSPDTNCFCRGMRNKKHEGFVSRLYWVGVGSATI